MNSQLTVTAEPRDIVGFVGLSGPYALVTDTRELRATFPPPYTQADWQPQVRLTGFGLYDESDQTALPEAVATGKEPLLVIGAIAGGAPS